jgi:hypothetical protein
MSILGYGQTEVKNSSLQTPETFNRGQYASINFVNTTAKNILWGGEFLWGSRKSNDGIINEDSRI